QTMGQALRSQHLACRHQADGVESKFGVLASARSPFAGPFAVEPDADADQWLDTHFFRGANSLFQFLQLLDHKNHLFAEFAPEKSDANEGWIFVTVANNEALRILVHGERGDQLGFASGFQPKMELFTCFDDFLDHFSKLIDFDRENAAITAPIIKFRDRGFKGPVDTLAAMTKKILERNDQWKTETARARFVDHFKNVNRAAAFLYRFGNDVAVGVNRKIATAPTFQVLGRFG